MTFKSDVRGIMVVGDGMYIRIYTWTREICTTGMRWSLTVRCRSQNLHSSVEDRESGWSEGRKESELDQQI